MIETIANRNENSDPHACAANPHRNFAQELASRRALVFRLEESQWQRIVDALPLSLAARSHNHCGRGADPVRRFIEGVLWVAHAHAYWYQTPTTYGNGHAIYVRFTRWAERGAWQPVIDALPEGSEIKGQLASLVARQAEARWMRRLSRELTA